VAVFLPLTEALHDGIAKNQGFNLKDLMKNYQIRLFDQYVSTHHAVAHEISVDWCKRHLRYFRINYLRFLPQDKDAKILDIGCGYGAFIYFLKHEGRQKVFGVDVSREQVELANKLGLENIEQADFVSYLEKCEGEFDCISAIDLMEHVPKEETIRVLELIFRALRKSGIFIMQVPNGAALFGSRILYWGFFP